MPMKHLDDLPDGSTDEAKQVAPPAKGIADMPTVYIESDEDLALEREALIAGTQYRSRGYRLYLEGKNPADIAKKLNVTQDAVLTWARVGDWAGRLRRKNDLYEKLVRENVRGKRLSHVEVEVESSLRISNKIRAKAETMLDDKGLTPMGLKNLADAAKASGDLGAHGMGEGGIAEGEAVKAGGGKVPLVMIFPSGGLPPPPETMKTVKEVRVDE